jgi:hypothetical protein
LRKPRERLGPQRSCDTSLVKGEGTTLRRLARVAPLLLSGPGASPHVTGQLRVRRLDGDLIDAARKVAMMTNE